MHKILQSYLRRLTNLSHHNRSLYLPRLTASQFIDVHDFNLLNNFSSFKIIEWLISGGKLPLESAPGGSGMLPDGVPLCAMVDSRDEQSNQMSEQVKKLARTDQFILDEQGSRDLYIGWPFVRGKFKDGTLVRCPLMFFPVNLEVQPTQEYGQQWVLKLRPEVAVSLNKSFLLAYAHYNELPFDEALSEKSFDEFDTDSRIFRTALYQLFKESAINLHFNQELFVDQLQPFTQYTKATLQEQEQDGLLKLYPEAVLGIFPQAGSYLVPDYLRLMENKHLPDLEAFFEKKASSERDLMASLTSLDQSLADNHEIQKLQHASRVREEQMFTPYRMDSHQEKAIRMVKRGNSIVVQGPPGTGKSQLITNLVADCIAHGRRVLVVSQKKAALDVVYNRLKDKELSPFVALVHDFKNDRKAVFQQLAAQVDALYEYQVMNNSLDSIYLERNFLKSSRRIEQVCEELDEFKFALFDENDAGISVKELYLTSDLNEPYISINHEYRLFKIPDMQPFMDKLRKFTFYALQYDKEFYTWYNRKPFVGYAVQDLKEMKRMLREIPGFKQQVCRQVSEVLHDDTDYASCEYLQGYTGDILKMLPPLEDEGVYPFFQHMVGMLDKDTDPLWLSNIERIIVDCFQEEGPEMSLPFSELDKFQSVLQQAEESSTGLVKWMNWKLFSKDKDYLTGVFEANGQPLDKKGFEMISKKMDNRLNLEHNLTKLREKEWLKDVPAKEETQSYNKAQLQNWFYQQKQALGAAIIFRNFRNFNEYFNIRKISFSELKERSEALVKILDTIPAKHKEWTSYLVPSQINIIQTEEQQQRYISTLEGDFEALCDYDTLKANLETHEKDVIYRLLEHDEDMTEERIAQLFQNSVRLAWIDHIELKYPVLRIVSSHKIRELEEELQQNIEEKLAISEQILLMKAREKTYYDVEYNRLNNMVTYRDLYHQVTKKRKVWPLRKLLVAFKQEVFSLVPCWMASPESVSAIFPMEDTPIFDLVIFDEASQCFAEKGIPAMYRARQVVVAGDSKQLSPNDIYQTRWTQEEESEDVADAVALESDSLLDLSSAYLTTVQLKGHYRSKTLDLVDFSNRHFYNQQLRMLPDYLDVVRNEPAISYIKVDGLWKDHTNDAESKEIVQLVFGLLKHEMQKSIGIITFNARQQEKILNDLEKAATEAAISLPASLFVKNIENVQGDEREIIIFSTGYAPNEQGKMIMQFGSLNAEKGENRLNVAVTRAKEKIYLVSSIYPSQLEVASAKNEGPKMLKAYLEYALQVSQKEYKPQPAMLPPHRTEWFLQNKLQHWLGEQTAGYVTNRDLPFADLSVKAEDDPAAYVGLINTDDDLFYQSESAKDIHAYRQFAFRKKNWRYTTIYSRQFWQNTEQTKKELIRFLNAKEESM